MAILERRRAAKWQKQVAVTVGEVQPFDTLDGNLALFPYTQVQELTKNYLGRRKRTQSEQDRLLVELIKAHPRKEVALASCAEALSEPILRELLNSDNVFYVDAVSLQGLEGYLQAFVAAAHSKDGLFSFNDREFAASLVPVARDVVQKKIEPSTAETLLSAWRRGAPVDQLLSTRVKLLTRKVCQYMRCTLESEHNQAWWIKVRDYGEALVLLKRTSVELEDCLQLQWPTWKRWANWSPPNAARLSLWESFRSSNHFEFFRELDGPALEASSGDTCELHRLIRRGEMLQWLQSKGIKLSPAFITSWSKKDLTQFVLELLDTVESALKKGSEHAELLGIFIDSQGLDSHPLRHWRRAIQVLPDEFVKLIITPSSDKIGVAVLIQGLKALSGENNELRIPLGPSTGKCISVVAERTRVKFLTCFTSNVDWTTDAEQLWHLRRAVALSTWIHSFLQRRLVTASQSQASKLALGRLADLHMSIKRIAMLAESNLDACLDVYVQSFITDGLVTSDETTKLPQVLHTLWICTEKDEYRRAAVVIAALPDLPLRERCNYIKHLLGLSEDIVKQLRLHLLELPNRDVNNLVSLTELVLRLTRTAASEAAGWTDLLRWTMKEYQFSVHALEFVSLGFKLYSKWICCLFKMFSTSWKDVDSTYKWLFRLDQFQETVNVIEQLPDSTDTMYFLLTRTDVMEQSYFLNTLECLSNEPESSRMEFMCSILLLTVSRRGPTDTLCDAMLCISKLEDEGFSFCQRLLALHYEDRDIASWRLRVWLQMSWLDFSTEFTLRQLGHLLGLGFYEAHGEASSIAPKNAIDYYAKRVAELVSKAQTLEQAQAALRKLDPDGVDSMLTELDIEQPTGAARLMLDLPISLVDVVEEVSQDVVELHFPLSLTNTNALERLAFGLEGTETLSVRLRVGPTFDVNGCCVHLQKGDHHYAIKEHKFFVVDDSHGPPHRLQCTQKSNGTTNAVVQDLLRTVFGAGDSHDAQYSLSFPRKSTRLTYTVAQKLWRELKGREKSLQEIYEAVDQWIHVGASHCMICGKELEVALHRQTLCSEDCVSVYNRSDLDVLLQDLRVDSRVCDTLLSSAFAAASIGKLELLPNLPTTFSNGPKVLDTLNALPATTNIDLTTLTPEAEQLLSWTFNNYRGFVISATDRYKIPNMHGIQQFLLVDAPPEVEKAFAQHNELKTRHILFHGTSMDRLYSVLAQGLRVLSGTALQKHGAVHGPGIYFAREPAFAMGFSSKTAKIDDAAPFFQSRGDFMNATVLLGCEHAGNDENTGLPIGMHLVTDPSRVMVRYIWIVPCGTKVPRAQDLKIPMFSTFNDLRSTASRRAKIDS